MLALSTIKSALKIDYDDDDRELTRLREAALSLIARNSQLALCVAEYPLYLTKWRDSIFPNAPFVAVSSITYTSGGSSVTMPGASYWIDRSDSMPVLRFMDTPGLDIGTAIIVTYSAGYSVLPAEITHAVISLVGHWYNNPEATQPIALSSIPLGLQYILSSISTTASLR